MKIIKLRKSSIPIKVLPEEGRYTADFLMKKFPNRTIFVCDFAIVELKKFSEYKDEIQEISGGYRYKNIINIDHHAPTQKVAKYIASTHLAVEFIKSGQKIPNHSIVVINHIDTDSVLSSSIMRGILPADHTFCLAALAGDHTAKPNEVADLLEALKPKRNLKSSLEDLEKLLQGAPLSKEVNKLLEQRMAERKEALEIVKKGQFKKLGRIYYAQFSKPVNLIFFVPLLPHAEVIMIGMPFSGNSKKNVIKVRLGLKAPKNLRLNEIKFSKKEDFGLHGRWNAGGNNRQGGTIKSLLECVKIMNRYIK